MEAPSSKTLHFAQLEACFALPRSRSRRHRAAALVLALALLLGCRTTTSATPAAAHTPQAEKISKVAAASAQRPRLTLSHRTVAGRAVDFFVPATAPTAVVVVLHGLDLNAGLTEQQVQLQGLAAQHSWLLVFPNGRARSWNAGFCCGAAARQHVDDVQVLDVLLSTIRADYLPPGSRAPIVLAGFSNGAMMAAEYACKRPHAVQALALIAGNLQDPSCRSLTGNLLMIRGDTDLTVPQAGMAYSQFLGTRLLPDEATLMAAKHGARWQSRTSRAAGVTTTRLTSGTRHLRVVVGGRLAHSWPNSAEVGIPSATQLLTSLVLEGR